MAPVPALLVALSALLHAAWNALLKAEADARAATAGALAVATLAAALAAWALPGPAFPRAAGLAWAAGAGLFEAGYFVALALAFRGAPLGLAYAVSRGGAIAIVWPLSAAFLGEAAAPRALAGAAAVVAGLAAVGVAGARLRAGGGLAWAALSAACIAGYHLCYKGALSAGAGRAPLFAASLATALPVVLAALGAEVRATAWRALRARPLRLGGAGLLTTLSFLLFLGALSDAGAGAALTLRNLSVVFAQGFALALGERPGRLQLAGAALVAGGAVLLSWP